MSPGDWVYIIGQINEKTSHPDDVCITLFSHNEEYVVHVRADRVIAAPIPDFAEPCSALRVKSPGYIVQCQRYAGHGGVHTRESYQWADELTDGYFEAR